MEPLVTIAIPDFADSTFCAVTLDALARHTPEPCEIVLFVRQQSDRDATTPLTRQRIQSVRRLPVQVPFSAPAALNRLLEVSATPYLLLLESGAVVTHGWLQRLLEPLNESSVGLSGPSTNICWNEQQVLGQPLAYHSTRWSNAQIDAYAANVATRYRQQRRALDTLHSLNDFCYLFKHQLAEDIGGFDEAYGVGPCWEIDFNTRAVRAGFRAIWVADVYVHRTLQPTRTQLFAANKQLYQDRFCGLHLRGEKTTYETHCRGEECPHFAPMELIQVRLQKGPVNKERQDAEAKNTTQDRTSSTSLKEQSQVLASEIPVATPQTRSTDALPLVSCIMPTRNRRTFVQQALVYFERQDYPNKELIIVDDGDDQMADLVASKQYVRYVALSQKMSIGAKRNLACKHAHGTIIAHWDDDDWYAPHRLSYQVAPLLSGQADLTGLETFRFFDVAHWQAWVCTPELHKRLFVGDVHGGTLVYHRSVWERLAKYPQVSLAEDAHFLLLACRQRARLLKLPHAQSFVYLRHEHNAWSFPLGTYLNPSGWQQVDPDTCIPADDLPFYFELRTARTLPAMHAIESQQHIIHSRQTNAGPIKKR